MKKSAIDLVAEEEEMPLQAKVIHQETDTVNCFCLNKVRVFDYLLVDDCGWMLYIVFYLQTNPNCLILASQKEITEVDVSMMLALDPLAWLEEGGHQPNPVRVVKGSNVNM